jgi:NAD-dependent DNA ligase
MDIKSIIQLFEKSCKDKQNILQNLDIITLYNIKNYLDDIYFNTSETKVNDDDYDTLVEIIKEKDKNYKDTIGAVIRETEIRVKAPYHMGSMNKIRGHKKEDEKILNKYISENSNCKYIIENKLDGVSCLLHVKNNIYKLYKRPGHDGNSADISYLLNYIKNIPKKLNNVVVRGELIIDKDIYNSKYKDTYNNPRNMVSGLTGGKTLKTGVTDIEFIAYELIDHKNTQTTTICPSKQIDLLNCLNFKVVDSEIVNEISYEILTRKLNLMKSISSYEIDGIIVQGDKEYNKNISGNPTYAFAYKHQSKNSMIETEVIEVQWNISKWNKLKPRIVIKPIQIDNVTIKYTTGFNAKYISDNKIGKGSKIVVTRAGDVIPHITEVLSHSIKPDMPCIGYTWNETNIDIYADENNTNEQSINKIHSFFSNLKIKHIATSTIQKLVENGYTNEIDILKATIQEMEQIKGFKNTLSSKIYNNIRDRMNNLNVSDIVSAAGLFGEGIGEKKTELIFSNIPNIFSLDKSTLETKLMDITGVSEKITKSIIDNIDDAKMYIHQISSIYPSIDIKSKTDCIIPNYGCKLQNKIIVFSGFRDSELELYIKQQGGKTTSAVSKNTTCVIVKDITESSSKILKAKKLDLPIYSKTDFYKHFQ